MPRWKEPALVRLKRDGSAGEWQVWGMELTDAEVRRAVADAVERIFGP